MKTYPPFNIKQLANIQVRSKASHAAGMMLYSLTFAMDPRIVLEIGTYAGYTAIHTALALSGNGRIWTIDIDGKGQQICIEESKRLGVNDKIKFIVGNSQSINWYLPIDILYIDGDHSYDAVLADFTKYSPHVSIKGVIVFHDTNNGLASKRVVNHAIISNWDCLHIDRFPGLTLCQRSKVSI